MQEKIRWKLFWDIVAEHRRFILTSHVRPDGDSIGSQMALAATLEAMGKETLLLNQDPVPPSLLFLDPEKKIRPLAELSEREKKFAASADCHILLDLSSWSQLGTVGELYRDGERAKVIIDHHRSDRDLPGTYFLDSEAEATGKLVFEALEVSGLPMSASTAFALMTAIATDTGWFRFSTVTPRTFEIAAELIRRGVDPAALYKQVNEQESFGRIRLVGRALANTEKFMDGKIYLTSLRWADFEATGALRSESEDIVNELLKIKGAEQAIIMVEQESGTFKISFRSRCAVDCSRLAARFNGGGHPQAAGASCDLPYDETKKALVDAAMAAARESEK
ncbi:MAG: DHH family phosphoesterase [Thermoguttaceae bacterium]|jgi:phosphoesterase RecJ-like protein